MLFDVDIIVAVIYLCSAIFSIVMTISVIFIFIGVADVVYQWWGYEKNLKMSKQEVKKMLRGNGILENQADAFIEAQDKYQVNIIYLIINKQK